MRSNKYVTIVLTGISLTGCYTNWKSFQYISNTFNVQDNLFNILIKDSLFTAICCALYSCKSIVSIINEDILRNNLGCSLVFFGLYCPSKMGPVTSFMISLRRFVQIKYRHFSMSSIRINHGTTFVMCTVAIFHLVFILVSAYGDLGIFYFIDACLECNEEHLDHHEVMKIENDILSNHCAIIFSGFDLALFSTPNPHFPVPHHHSRHQNSLSHS